MNEQRIHDYFREKGLNEYGIAGLMGNLFAESGLNPWNLQNSYEDDFNMSDAAYVAAVDNGTYKNFVNDKAGFGIAQWTFWKRKENLLDFARAVGKSIGDLDMQLDFLTKEMSESFPSVWRILHHATSVLEASNAVLLKFECPADQSEGVQEKRAGFGQRYYNQFATPVDELDIEQFKILFQELRAGLQDNDCGTWSAEARQWAVASGLIAGNGAVVNGEPNYMWQDFMTREQCATVLHRFAKIVGLTT